MGAVVTVKRGETVGLIVKEELLYRATSTGQNHDRTRQHIMQGDNAQVSILCKETIHTSAYYARRQCIRQHIMQGDNTYVSILCTETMHFHEDSAAGFCWLCRMMGWGKGKRETSKSTVFQNPPTNNKMRRTLIFGLEPPLGPKR